MYHICLFVFNEIFNLYCFDKKKSLPANGTVLKQLLKLL